ncbi:acylphosphatase [Bacillus sp. 03113]|uniref:acylphosphatase n=1 Tax=Bacillus sp. 03113 TaxID=2578211 RepID=UPI0015E8BF34|nr:acylphosphatase [Bacillus sp. 03113]
MNQVHMIVFGRVQGVGFRYFAQMKAVQYNIKGWTRNLSDGTVEIVALGEQDQLTLFIEEIRRGNPFSKVTNIDITPVDQAESFNSFSIRY